MASRRAKGASKVPTHARTLVSSIVPCTQISGSRSIANAKAMTLPEIIVANPILSSDLKINPKCTASYAVVTYWWGCGNLNKNTQLPCPEDAKLGEPLAKNPISYESMIARFGEICEAAGCHYIAKEYPQFAVPGGYQKAINAKPYFIAEALNAAERAGLRGVLYIDGDMDMKACPRIFDMHDIDVALRGWNMDPRSSKKAYEDKDDHKDKDKPDYIRKTSKVCFDQRVLETSGGTMYFSTSPASRYLLNSWILRCNDKGTAGKADDRILSELIVANNFHVSMNIIQLPIEYLWLSQSYNNYLPKDGESNALITHPLCLTGEERAADQGAATNRNTLHYDKVVSTLIKCKNHGGVFYEQVFFDKKEQIDEYRPYLNYIGKARLVPFNEIDWIPPMYVMPWGRMGIHTDTFNNNLKSINSPQNNAIANAAKVYPINVLINSVTMENSEIDIVNISASEDDSTQDIAQIIIHLRNDEHVFYHPSKQVLRIPFNKMLTQIRTMYKGASPQFMTVNLKEDDIFKPNFDSTAPMYFAPGSNVLIKMLLMCQTVADINDIFRSSDIFWSRIRCVWIAPSEEEPLPSSAVKVPRTTTHAIERSLQTKPVSSNSKKSVTASPASKPRQI